MCGSYLLNNSRRTSFPIAPLLNSHNQSDPLCLWLARAGDSTRVVGADAGKKSRDGRVVVDAFEA